MRYGYDSPESFGRAFARFHGILPSQAKFCGAALKLFSRLSVKLILDGGNMMDYRMEKTDSFKIIVKKKWRVLQRGNDHRGDIGVLAGSAVRTEQLPRCASTFRKIISSTNVLSVLVSEKMRADESFPYAIGAVYNGLPVADEGFTVEEIPAHTYAVFKCIGKMPEAFQKLYHQIYSGILPAERVPALRWHRL